MEDARTSALGFYSANGIKIKKHEKRKTRGGCMRYELKALASRGSLSNENT
ncbi:MAG: hypothetical protein O9340_06595 [Cyclobacteriaceae bacterium]|nr:hypothetical protein [Cyclobacteriaceae bacterium]